jgi:hypothetical protein
MPPRTGSDFDWSRIWKIPVMIRHSGARAWM